MTADQVKGDLRSRIRLYDPSAYRKTAEEYRLLSDFQHALENREIFFCLQPQCKASTGAIVGAESLARWRRPDGTMIPPGQFVPILEKYGMITSLDRFMWEEVCAWLRRWLDAGHKAVPVSMNVSRTDVLSIDVPACFEKLLKKYSLPASLIKIEITESTYMDDTETVRDTVRRLRAMGILVMMDDFGSGYSSLNMLRSMNMDVIKLDAQFLRIKAQEERKGISIVESIVNMAKIMFLPIVVEGVETQEQLNFLSDLGCRYIQGYYFYHPLPLSDFELLIRDERRLDQKGFEAKSNEQIHPREFLDENVFSDAMLNNILGPVAILHNHGGQIDIVRYNQQFYQLTGLEVKEMDSIQTNIRQFMYGDDGDKLAKALDEADQDRLNGARITLRIKRPNQALRWVSIQAYYFNDAGTGKNYYCACEDVTEIQFINVDLPGGYHRCTVDNGYEFRNVSKNFQDMTGYTEAEIRALFGNKLINMVHPDDRGLVNQRKQDLLAGREPSKEPFRLRCKNGEYTLMNDYMSGEFPVLKPGMNAISWTGTVTSVVIRPNWRFL